MPEDRFIGNIRCGAANPVPLSVALRTDPFPRRDLFTP
jgi:hypothetical protein